MRNKNLLLLLLLLLLLFIIDFYENFHSQILRSIVIFVCRFLGATPKRPN